MAAINLKTAFGQWDTRLWDKIMPCPNTGCWIWIGAISKNGYGNFWHNEQYRVAHRVVYEEANGEIPRGLELDHLCRNRACVNPLHLEAVPPHENVRRGVSPSAKQAKQTHCKRGHTLTGEHLYLEKTRTGRTKRHCYTCMRNRRRTISVRQSSKST